MRRMQLERSSGKSRICPEIPPHFLKSTWVISRGHIPVQLLISSPCWQDAEVLKKMYGVQLVVTRYTPRGFVWEVTELDMGKFCQKLCWVPVGKNAV